MTVFDVLQSIGWPTTILILDFETFINKDYHLNTKRKGGCSITEYLADPRFKVLGTAGAIITPDSNVPCAFFPEQEIKYILMDHPPSKTVIVGHNLIFDGTILTDKFGYLPEYAIDTIALSRYFEARGRHNLDACCERWVADFEEKIDILSKVQGKTWRQMRPDLRKQMREYAISDGHKAHGLFDVLLPRLPRPDIELPFILNTLKRYWVPRLLWDYEKAEKLTVAMNSEMDMQVEKVVL